VDLPLQGQVHNVQRLQQSLGFDQRSGEGSQLPREASPLAGCLYCGQIQSPAWNLGPKWT
jgi:hypothetical protein